MNVWKSKKKSTVLNWPTMNPDLNPIESLWRELKSDIGERNPATIEELKQIAKEEWEKLPVPADRCKQLRDGYKRRLKGVIIPKGCVIKY